MYVNDKRVFQFHDRHHIPGEESEDSLFSTGHWLLYSQYKLLLQPSHSLAFYLTVVLFWVMGLKMSFKSYADAVSGSSREEKSLAKLSNIVGITAQDYKEREVTWPCHATLHSKKKELSWWKKILSWFLFFIFHFILIYFLSYPRPSTCYPRLSTFYSRLSTLEN